MKYVILSALIFYQSGYAQNHENEPYLLQPGDLLEVAVWQDENLLRQVRLRPDGGISFPLVGSFVAEGLSIDGVTREIEEKLSKYIPDPVITVSLVEASGNRIYVLGKVTAPGEYVVTRNVDVLQALSMAGGVTAYAAVKNIKVLRRENGKLVSTNFNYSDVEKGRNLEQSIVLQGGDIVLVP